RETLQHVREDRTALTATRRITRAAPSIAGTRRWAEPRFGERDRLEAVAIRVREQLRRGAISRATGRRVGREQLAQRPGLAARVREPVRVLDLDEQVARAFAAAARELLRACGQVGD